MKIWKKTRPAIFFLILFGCSSGDEVISPFFSVKDDIELGHQVNAQIRNDTTGQFPILDEDSFPEAYQHIRRILNNILDSDEFNYKERFAYDSIKIINADVMNAFATPGGYIYVYTGLIKYLESEDHLAGVISHEIAHAERRHSIRRIQTQYGFSVVSAVILGNDPSALAQIAASIAGGLGSLKFSRKHESESDDYSVRYLSHTEYACNGAAGFFRKLEDEGRCNESGEWLSTHPDPCNRVDAIDQRAAELQCKTTELNPGSYQDFINSLPQ